MKTAQGFKINGKIFETRDPADSIKRIYQQGIFKSIKQISSQFDFEDKSLVEIINQIELEFIAKLNN